MTISSIYHLSPTSSDNKEQVLRALHHQASNLGIAKLTHAPHSTYTRYSPTQNGIHSSEVGDIVLVAHHEDSQRLRALEEYIKRLQVAELIGHFAKYPTSYSLLYMLTPATGREEQILVGLTSGDAKRRYGISKAQLLPHAGSRTETYSTIGRPKSHKVTVDGIQVFAKTDDPTKLEALQNYIHLLYVCNVIENFTKVESGEDSTATDELTSTGMVMNGIGQK